MNLDRPNLADEKFFKEYEELFRKCCDLERELQAARAVKEKIIEYCAPHTDKMWSATILGIIFECDFKDASQRVSAWREVSNEKR